MIVNADSVQLYRSLPTLTARPTPTDLARAEHLLYGILDDDERGSVAQWLKLAVAAIWAVQPRLAIVTGGTGFYLEALLAGLADVPATPPELRAASGQAFARLGHAGFAAELGRLDPRLASRGLPKDPQRLRRAWEVCTLTGRSLTDWEGQRTPPSLPPWRGGVALLPPREVLWHRIDRRTRAMVGAGVVDEIAAWRAGPDAGRSPLRHADGVAAFGEHLDGRITLDAAIVGTSVKVRRYAKRQRTWLRHRLPVLVHTAEVGESLLGTLGDGVGRFDAASSEVDPPRAAD